MPILSPKLRLAYHDVPKIACTSIKTFFWSVDQPRPLRTAPVLPLVPKGIQIRLGLMDRMIHAQPGYRSQSWDKTPPRAEGYETLVVLRDPILRLHSAWKNKASRSAFARRGEIEDLHQEGLSDHPAFSDFVANIDHYRMVSRPARIHTHPLAFHIGPDLGYYDHVFKLEQFPELTDFLSVRLGAPAVIGRENSSPEEPRDGRLDPAQVDRLLEYTRGDYDLVGAHYDPEAAIARLVG